MPLGLGTIMSKRGEFSRNFFSLQLQIQTLLESAGGEETCEFLDSLSELNKSEQGLVLKLFKRVVERLLAGNDRLVTAEDIELKNFEEGLYADIVNSLRHAAQAGGSSNSFEVVDGGKIRKARRQEKKPLDFVAARRAKLSSNDTILN
ncbi:MAG: hypothetical protein KDD55_04835 [Bdellovibrionales bacterium]|nr:hypothetical protein [Bdellovibrionales bacterium]